MYLSIIPILENSRFSFYGPVLEIRCVTLGSVNFKYLVFFGACVKSELIYVHVLKERRTTNVTNKLLEGNVVGRNTSELQIVSHV